MKKIIALLLVVAMIATFTACKQEKKFDPSAKSEGTMTHEQYIAAKVDDAVTVECFVQGHQSWWDNKITLYAQDPQGGYFMYEMECSEENSKKLVPGTKIKVTGYKAEWAGEIEIVDAKFEIMEGTWVATAADLTASIANEAEMLKHQNELVALKGLTVESIEFKNGEPGDDIYVNVSINGASYQLCVERYLTDPESEVYKTVSALVAGDVIDVEGFLYWYNGLNPHLTKVTKK